MSTEPNSATNHELLIRLDEKVKSVLYELKDIKDNLGARVAVLEEVKLGKDEAYRLLADSVKVREDHERRIREQEKTMISITTKMEDQRAELEAQMKRWGLIISIAAILASIAIKFL